ncbi:MAG: histidine phosphatase family protein [Deltaproteobacteria bacterium]|nr:histidine phosphatase family protein [Deltaproteobacteria bacterium]
MPTTRILLIRHGATNLSAEDRFAGSTDVDLSETGRAQALALGSRLAGHKLSAIYASPLRRTVDTARLIAVPHALPVGVRDGLREISHGRWEQLTRRDVETRFPEEYAAWEEDPFTFAPVGGESGAEVMARALPVVRQIVLDHAGSTVAVISHKATIRLILCGLLGIDARGYRDRLEQSPTCLNVLDFKDPVRARLQLYNDTSHYEGVPRSPGAGLSKWWDPR